MSDRRIDELLRMLDPEPGHRLWHGGATPLGSLRGVSPEEAAWRPAAQRHSIWELTLHLAYWKYAVLRRIDGSPRGGFPRQPSNWPRVPDPPAATAWRRDRALLKSEHEKIVATVRELDPSRLDQETPGSGAYRYADLLYGVMLHDTYHVGQIQLLKRLYRDKLVAGSTI